MPLIKTKELDLNEHQKIVQYIFKAHMDGERNLNILKKLQDMYKAKYMYLRNISRIVGNEIKLFTCNKKTRYKFLQDKDKIEDVLRKFGVIFFDEKGKKYLIRRSLISYQAFCNEMAKVNINMTIEEARGVLGEYHMAAFYPFCNYDYIIVKDLLSGDFEVTGRYDYEIIAKQLLEFYKTSNAFKNNTEMARNFLKNYFIFMKLEVLATLINMEYFEFIIANKTNSVLMQNDKTQTPMEYFDHELPQIDTLKSNGAMQTSNKMPPVKLRRFFDYNSSQLSKDQEVKQCIFKMYMIDRKITSNFLKDLANKHDVDAENVRYNARCIDSEIELFTCDKKIRLKFLWDRDKIEKVLREVGIMLFNENGKKCLNRECYITYREFCNEMAKRGVKMTINEARGILGEYHIAVFYPFCNYNYAILSNNPEVVLEGKPANFKEELSKFCKNNEKNKACIELAKDFLKEYFIFTTVVNLEKMICKYKRHIFAQDMTKETKNECYNRMLPQTELTTSILMNDDNMPEYLSPEQLQQKPTNSLPHNDFKINTQNLPSSTVCLSRSDNHSDANSNTYNKDGLIGELSSIFKQIEDTYGSLQQLQNSSASGFDTTLKRKWTEQIKQDNRFRNDSNDSCRQ